jgi:hypothetical protein
LRDDVGATVFKLFILTTVVPPPPNGCSNDYKVQKLFRTRQQLILKKKKNYQEVWCVDFQEPSTTCWGLPLTYINIWNLTYELGSSKYLDHPSSGI